MINYYEILEVSEKASKEVIEKAYKALAKKYHPDLNHDNPKEAEAKMKQLNEAFDVLIDDSKRANFDNILAKKRELEAQKKQQNTFYNTAESNFTATRPANIAEANKISYSNNVLLKELCRLFWLLLLLLPFLLFFSLFLPFMNILLDYMRRMLLLEL